MSLSRARLAVKRAAAPTGTAPTGTAANGVRWRRYGGEARPRASLRPSSSVRLPERHLCLLRITDASREFCAPYTPARQPLKGGRRWWSSTAAEQQQGPSSSNGIGGDPSGSAANNSNSNPLSSAGKLFFGSLCVGTFALGCWQTSRLFEKQQLIEERSKELERPPLSPSSALDKETVRPGSFQRLEMKGQYDHAREMLVGPRGAPSTGGSGSSGYGGNMPSRQGYFVVTPFVTAEGDVYLVNRGWVPRNAVVPIMSPQQQHFQQQQRQRREQEEAARGGTGSRPFSSNVSDPPPSPPRLLEWSRPSGTTTVHALPSILEKPRFLVANHNYRERPVQLYWFDTEAMQKLVQRQDAVLVTAYNDDTNHDGEDSDPSLFQPVRPNLESLQEFKVSPAVHVAYAFTWFSLSVAGLIMTRRLATSSSVSASGAAAAAAAASAAAKSVR